jgi:hypothetical protein
MTLLYAVFRAPRRKLHTRINKYLAAGSPELAEGQAKD